MTARFIVGDTRAVTASLPDGSVDFIMSSPPYLALRSYLPADHPMKALEIGSEATPAEFIDVLLALTAEWRRILNPRTGSIVIELGDTYAGSGGGGGDYLDGGWREGQAQFAGSAASMRESNAAHWRQKAKGKDAWPMPKSATMIPESYRVSLTYGRNILRCPLTAKEALDHIDALIETGFDAEYAIAQTKLWCERHARGDRVIWYDRWQVRNTITRCSPNPPVGALGKKWRPATTDLVVATPDDDKRYWDDVATRVPAVRGPRPNELAGSGNQSKVEHRPEWNARVRGSISNPEWSGAPLLDWWQIVAGGYPGAHYAVYPPELCEPPIEAMCPRRVCLTCGEPSRRETDNERTYWRESKEPPSGRNNSRNDGGAGPFNHDTVTTTTGWSTCGHPGTDGIRLDGFHTGTGWRPGIVLDPFGGTATTAVVAAQRYRDALVIDLDDRNLGLTRARFRSAVYVRHELVRATGRSFAGMNASWNRGRYERRPYHWTYGEWVCDPRVAKPKGAKTFNDTHTQRSLFDLLEPSAA